VLWRLYPRHVAVDKTLPRPQPFDHLDWIFEAKFDRFRATAHVVRGRLVSRNGNLMSRFAGDQIAVSLDVGDAILDGEIIAHDETGRPQFYKPPESTRP